MASKVKVEPDMLAALQTIKDILANNLLEYSGWLESQGLMKKPKKKDNRTHEDLVNEFLFQE